VTKKFASMSSWATRRTTIFRSVCSDGCIPGADDFWDGNWLATPIEAVVGKFQGKVGASLRADELRSFRDALKILSRRLTGRLS